MSPKTRWTQQLHCWFQTMLLWLQFRFTCILEPRYNFWKYSSKMTFGIVLFHQWRIDPSKSATCDFKLKTQQLHRWFQTMFLWLQFPFTRILEPWYNFWEFDLKNDIWISCKKSVLTALDQNPLHKLHLYIFGTSDWTSMSSAVWFWNWQKLGHLVTHSTKNELIGVAETNSWILRVWIN